MTKAYKNILTLHKNKYITKLIWLKGSKLFLLSASFPVHVRCVAAFTQKINCLHIISAKKIYLLALKNIITDMGRIPLFQYN
jgi:hypothetical protein